jgi:phosphomevalonate kinase
MKLQYETLNKAYTLLEDISFSDKQATDLVEKLNTVKDKVVPNELKNVITDLSNRLEKIHKELVATSPNRLSGEVQLAEKVADIYSGIISYSGKPTDSQMQGLNLYSDVFTEYRNQMDKILTEDLTKINTELKKINLEEIKAISRENYEGN